MKCTALTFLEVVSFPQCDELVIQKFMYGKVWNMVPHKGWLCMLVLCSIMFMRGCAYDTVNATLQLPTFSMLVGLQVSSFDWPVSLAFLLGW